MLSDRKKNCFYFDHKIYSISYPPYSISKIQIQILEYVYTCDPVVHLKRTCMRVTSV